MLLPARPDVYKRCRGRRDEVAEPTGGEAELGVDPESKFEDELGDGGDKDQHEQRDQHEARPPAHAVTLPLTRGRV
jgi:hypothetical protein